MLVIVLSFIFIFTNKLSMFMQAVKICHDNFSKIEGVCEIYRKGFLQCKNFIEKVMQLIEESLHLGMFFNRIFIYFCIWAFCLFEFPCFL